jgi:hypothetical protein
MTSDCNRVLINSVDSDSILSELNSTEKYNKIIIFSSNPMLSLKNALLYSTYSNDILKSIISNEWKNKNSNNRYLIVFDDCLKDTDFTPISNSKRNPIYALFYFNFYFKSDIILRVTDKAIIPSNIFDLFTKVK